MGIDIPTSNCARLHDLSQRLRSWRKDVESMVHRQVAEAAVVAGGHRIQHPDGILPL